MTEQRNPYNNSVSVRNGGVSLERETDSERARETASSSTTNQVTYSRARAHAGDSMRLLLAEYEYQVEDADRYVMNLMREALEAGMEADVIRSAIRDTARARRPSKRYFEAIISRYRAEGIMNMTELIRDKDRHEMRMSSAKRRRHADWYDDDTVLTEYDRSQLDNFVPEPGRDYGIDQYIPVPTADYIQKRSKDILK